MKIGLQMYSLRNENETDLIGRLEKAAEIGYEGVEFAGFEDLPASKIKSTLDRLGLQSLGNHTGVDQLTHDKIDATIEYNLEIGSKYVTIPWAKYETMEQIDKAAEFINKAGEKCSRNGMPLLYHNHNHEFALVEGEHVLDLLFKKTDSRFLQSELDTYWVQYAGVDVKKYIRKLGKRCPVIHQKDMEAGEGRGICEVGNGIMDIKGIHNIAEQEGAEWFVVEQDVCRNYRPFECVAISYRNIRSLYGI